MIRSDPSIRNLGVGLLASALMAGASACNRIDYAPDHRVDALPSGAIDPGLLREARGGDLAAQFRIATMRLTAPEGERDPEAAVHWYRRAAEAGHAPSQSALGRMLVEGKGRDRIDIPLTPGVNQPPRETRPAFQRGN